MLPMNALRGGVMGKRKVNFKNKFVMCKRGFETKEVFLKNLFSIALMSERFIHITHNNNV